MADLITGNTQLSATKQDLIAAFVQKELKFNAILAPYVYDASVFAVKGAKSISFPKLTSFTVTNRASGAAGDSSVLTSSVDKLDLNINAYVAWIIDSMDEAQTTVEAQLEFARRAASAHGRYVDEQIIATLEAAFGLDIGIAPLTRDLVLDAREELRKNHANFAQVTMLVGPDQEKALLKIDEFTRAEVYGSAVVPNGIVGKLYGMPVIVHSGVAAGKTYWWDKDGIAIGFQKAPAMSEQGANEYGTGSKRVAMDQLFGTKGLQLGELGKGASSSPLIVKM